MKGVSPTSLLDATMSAATLIQKNPELSGSAVSAGFLIPKGQKRGQRKGHQVFVQIKQWDESKGGLQ